MIPGASKPACKSNVPIRKESYYLFRQVFRLAIALKHKVRLASGCHKTHARIAERVLEVLLVMRINSIGIYKDAQIAAAKLFDFLFQFCPVFSPKLLSLRKSMSSSAE